MEGSYIEYYRFHIIYVRQLARQLKYKERGIMERFFQRFEDSPKITVTLEEIIPKESTEASIKERAVYISYAKKITRRSLDDRLRFYRQKALVGALSSEDFDGMNELLTVVQKQAQYDGYMMPLGKESGKFYAYARVKSYAMLIAQILFVNNSIQEGLMERIEKGSIAETLEGVSKFVENCSKENIAPVGEDEARFYATLFLLQTAFDKYFVPDGDIVTYDAKTGDYQVAESYDECTAYLALSNKKVITATTAEKELCYNITSGWGEGIDLVTWDKLNEYYYGAISPTTGEENLFTKNYDVILERMLPQFGLARVRLSEAVLREKTGNPKLTILEIGAGSGAFPIDLIMACKRLGIPIEEVKYYGVEPSDYMRKNFRANIERKIGDTHLPRDWKLVDGNLEKVGETPENYIHKDEITIVVICYTIHHCFHESVKEFFANRVIRDRARAVFVLDVVKEHGWTKPYYMWADCESPENFDNVGVKGSWSSKTIWTEPCAPIEGHCVTNAWVSLREML